MRLLKLELKRVRNAVETYQASLTCYGVTESYDLPEGVYGGKFFPSPLCSTA